MRGILYAHTKPVKTGDEQHFLQNSENFSKFFIVNTCIFFWMIYNDARCFYGKDFQTLGISQK
jgi:hypothetical protein